MSILITGAAGFVGSRLARELLARGEHVIGLDNFDPYYARAHKDRHLGDLRDHQKFDFHRLDLRDAQALRELFGAHSIASVVHLAAMAAVRYSVQHPLLYGEVNVQGTTNLLDAARHYPTDNGNARCILASTGSVYGRDTPMPFREDAPAIHPLAPYPASKRAMEIMAHAFHRSYQMPIAIARFFNVYGPHGRPDMMPWQWTMQIQRGETLTLFDGGKLKRDWTYIDDIVRGLIAILDAEFDWEIWNLGCGRPVENLQFVKILENLLGKSARVENVPAPASEPFETFADISKAQRMLGYQPQVEVEQGLANFVEWLRVEGLLDEEK